MTPIKLYIEDDEAIDTTLELFLPQFDAKTAAAIRLEVVLHRGVYIGGGGASPAFAVHLDRQERRG